MKIASIFKNTFWGVTLQLTSIVIGFITQKVFISNLGIEYQGLNSLLTNLISVLSIAELGFGTAIIFALYEPLHKKNIDKVCAIMSFYRKVYINISIAILLCGIIMSFFINLFIKDSSFSNEYLRLVFILFVINSSVSYLFSYRSSLFYADQKNFYNMYVNLCILIVGSLFKILFIVKTKNYAIVITSMIFFTILSNYTAYWLSNRVYPFLKIKPNQALNKCEKITIFNDVKNLAISRIVDMSIFQTDNILIAKFSGLVSLGLYSNYSIVIVGVRTFVNVIFNAIQPALADILINREIDEQKEKILNSYSLFVYFLATFCCCSYIVLLNDFIVLWLGEKYIIDGRILLLLILSQYFAITNQPVWVMSYASGLFKEIRNIGIIAALTNIITSTLFGYFYGISGVVLGTCFCYAISILMQTHLTYNAVIKNNKVFSYLLIYFCRMLLATAICFCTYYLSLKIILASKILEFALKVLLCLLFPNVINALLFRNNEHYSSIKEKILSHSKG